MMDALENRVEKCERDIGVLYSKANESAIAQTRISTQLDNVLLAIGKLEKALEQLQSKPAQKWESLVSQVISVAVAAVIGGIIGGLI